MMLGMTSQNVVKVDRSFLGYNLVQAAFSVNPNRVTSTAFGLPTVSYVLLLVRPFSDVLGFFVCLSLCVSF